MNNNQIELRYTVDGSLSDSPGWYNFIASRGTHAGFSFSYVVKYNEWIGRAELGRNFDWNEFCKTNRKLNAMLLYYGELIPDKHISAITFVQPAHMQFPSMSRYYESRYNFFFQDGINKSADDQVGDIIASTGIMGPISSRMKNNHDPHMSDRVKLEDAANPKLLEMMIDTYRDNKLLVISWANIPKGEFYENAIVTSAYSKEIFKAMNKLPQDIAKRYSIGLNVNNQTPLEPFIITGYEKTGRQVQETITENQKIIVPVKGIGRFFGVTEEKMVPVPKKIMKDEYKNTVVSKGSPLNLVTTDYELERTKNSCDNIYRPIGENVPYIKDRVYIKWSDIFT
ncbi:MAG: hypothetical protein WC599_14195 [Bacteroidales bacterium]